MRTTRRMLLGGIGALALVTMAPAAADAATATVTGTVSGSTLSIATSATPSFSDSLDSGDQTQTYTIPSTVQDTRGSGAGWNLTITSTQFAASGGNTLATSASQLTGVTSACVSGGTCTNPTNAITYPLTVPAAATAPTAVKFFNSATSTGMGKFTITPTVGVFVPQSSAAGSYTSTVTLSIVSGP